MAVETIAGGTGFRAARRELTSVLAPVEKRCLIRIAQALPTWVTSDHLTGLALAAMLSAGLSYWLSRITPAGLWLVNVSLAINWFGDSLDGTVARVRRQERLRYGFYVDHVVDLFGAVFLLGGLALSGYMSAYVALGLLGPYLMLCVEIFLATHCIGTFKMSFFRIGPTELRILLAIGNVALMVQPTTTLFGRTFNLFDVSGVIGTAGLVVTVVVSAVSNTRALYRAEPVAR